MVIYSKNLVSSKFIENVDTTQYTANRVTTIIDKFTVTNISGGGVLLTVNIVDEGGSVSTSNLIIYQRYIYNGETYICPEIVGQVINKGQFISAKSGTASALVLRVSGRELN